MEGVYCTIRLITTNEPFYTEIGMQEFERVPVLGDYCIVKGSTYMIKFVVFRDKHDEPLIYVEESELIFLD